MIYGTGYLIVVREDGGPELHFLTESERDGLYSGLALVTRAESRAYVLRHVFGSTVSDAFPVSLAEMLAETYDGPGRDMVRAMAALVALGESIPCGDDTGPSGNGGGAGDRIEPDGPRPVSPNPLGVTI